uniref:Uncharacterized protein n=1 Tax=Timema tahoe TaxID=61484 RepID=A0A7R9IBM2_9NEOP|nr:unnamed protein product [Timema tahoe]
MGLSLLLEDEKVALFNPPLLGLISGTVSAMRPIFGRKVPVETLPEKNPPIHFGRPFLARGISETNEAMKRPEDRPVFPLDKVERRKSGRQKSGASQIRIGGESRKLILRAGGVGCADLTTPSSRRSRHYLHQQKAAARSMAFALKGRGAGDTDYILIFRRTFENSHLISKAQEEIYQNRPPDPVSKVHK